MKIKNYILEIIVFICGAVVMMFELVGSRILGPYFGTSIFVWTSLMGIILGSLSLGYYLGGKIADKKPNVNVLSLIIFLSSLSIIITFLTKDIVISTLQNYILDIRVGSILGSVFLFLPTSLLLGMVSPYAVKLKLNNLNISGSTVGNLSAVSTMGSIFGTFLSGFYLIPKFGTNKLLIILAIILFLISLLFSIKKYIEIKLLFLTTVIILFISLNIFNLKSEKRDVIDVDTAYNRVWIYDYIDSKTNMEARMMGVNNENHSSMYLHSNELANEYLKYYDLAEYFKPNFRKTLLLGGAGYSYPKYFLEKYTESTIDVVEIDSKITELARKYFRLKEDPRLTIYHEDGRVYLNRTKEKYDIIFGDAFGSHYSLPYQLTTKEAVQKKYDILNDDGIVILNIIGAIEGKKGKFLRAEYATYKSIFPNVYLFLTDNLNDGKIVQNVILVALKSTNYINFKLNTTDENISKYLNNLWKKEIVLDVPILTDDYAPVDSYMWDMI
jgi:spermidine synthase